jgi:hypothetical protein
MGDSMSTIINATTTNGVVIQPDNSGSLVLQTNSGTTALTIDTSQRAAFVAGTAALPAITTTGDTNTGIWFPAADTIAFAEGGTESMRIDSSGNVGIGTASPLCKLAIGAGSLSDGNVLAQINAATSSATYLGLNKGGTYGGLIGYSNGGTGSTGLHIRNVAADPILFYVNNTTEAMRIDSSGNVLVGTTSTTPRDFTSGTGTKLPASGGPIEFATTDTNCVFFNYTATTSGSATFVTFRQQGSNRGSISTNGSTTAYNTTSDYRLKENITPITDALDIVAQLKPSTYTWKETGVNSQGFIAHELQAVVPDCVTGEKDAVETYTDKDGIEQTRIKPQGVDTSFLVATLTAAIQEQQTIINDLKARVTVLEAK